MHGEPKAFPSNTVVISCTKIDVNSTAAYSQFRAEASSASRKLNLHEDGATSVDRGSRDENSTDAGTACMVYMWQGFIWEFLLGGVDRLEGY